MCRSCECPTNQTNNQNVRIKYRRSDAINALVEKSQLNILKDMSQHYVHNAFRLIQFGTHNKRGVFGACPGEILHLVQLGWFKYTMQAFVSQVGQSSSAMTKFNNLCSIVGTLLHRQSDRNIPKTRLPNGFVGTPFLPK